MTYQEALLSPEISWENVMRGIPIPSRLYKYQSFYKTDGTENEHWMGNIGGQFHMSLGCEFEDINDCKPFFNKNSICSYIVKFLEEMNAKYNVKDGIINEIHALSNDWFKSITENYQKMIRIGCFTNRNDYEEMWQKYGAMKKGYCIEYDTSKNKLFQLSTLPVLYQDHPYDSSLTFANSLILESNRKGKHHTIEENLEIFAPIYEKLLKTAYIPLFIKQRSLWEFEHEYRMFLLKNRNVQDGMLRSEKYLDGNNNIDLAQAINAVYLGEQFEKNNNADELRNRIARICRENDIALYQRVIDGNKSTSLRIT